MASTSASSSSSPSPPIPPPAPPGLSRLPILLPLLPSPPTARDALEPPTHLLPNGEVRPSRIVHRQPASASASGGGAPVEWISTTHLYPSAYPRSHPASTCPPCALGREERDEELLASATGSKQQEASLRQRDLERWERIKARYAGSNTGGLYDCPEAEEEAEERAKELAAKAFPQLWSVAQRIVPVEVPGRLPERTPAPRSRSPSKGAAAAAAADEDDSQAYTLILAHANGFHKETFEPMLRSLLDALQSPHQSSSSSGKKQKRVQIDEIWSLDSLGAGEGGPLVRETVGEVFSWFDAARDIEQLVSRCLPDQQATGRGEWGPRWPGARLSSRAPRSGGGSEGRRRFIGVGHSVSGAAMAMLAGCRPGLFDAVVLIDPVTAHKDNFSTALSHPYPALSHPAAQGAIVRRHTWLNGSAAAAYFSSRPFFQAWNKEVLESFTRFCLRPLSGVKGAGAEGAVTLATSRWSEANVFASSAVGCFALAALMYGGARPTSATTTDDEDDSQPTTTAKPTPVPTKIWHLSASLPRSVQTEKDTLAIEEAIRRGVVEGRFGKGSGYERLDAEGADHLVVQQQPGFVGKKLAEVLGRLFGGGEGDEQSQRDEQSFRPPGARL